MRDAERYPPAYLGLRGERQLPWGHGGPTSVGVRDRHGYRPLPVPPSESWRPTPIGFEWGYEGGGPLTLAQAILTDCLGFEPNLAVALAFQKDVVVGLPPEEFELLLAEVQAWINRELARARGIREDAIEPPLGPLHGSS